jgi:hypothetical protein
MVLAFQDGSKAVVRLATSMITIQSGCAPRATPSIQVTPAGWNGPALDKARSIVAHSVANLWKARRNAGASSDSVA